MGRVHSMHREKRNAHRVSEEKPEGRRALGRPRRTCKKKLRGLSPQENYADRKTAAC
jgi:hypothetical protein